MKKILLATIISFIIVLSGCKSSKENIMILMYDQEDIFISEFSNKIKEELNVNYDVTLYNCKNSQLAQNEIILETLQTVDMYIINLVDRVSASSIIQILSKNNIPVIFYNREPNKSDITLIEHSYFVGGDSSIDGHLQADVIDKLYKYNSNLIDKDNDNVINTVYLKGEKYHQDAEKRTEASLKKLRELGYQINILETVYCNWNYKLGYDAAKDLYNKYNNIELIISNNDEMAVGAIDYFIEIDLFKDKYIDEVPPIIILGVDGTKTGLQYVEDGTLYASILNDKDNQTNAILEIVDLLFDSNYEIQNNISYEITNDRFIYIDGKIITKS